jgi:integrase
MSHTVDDLLQVYAAHYLPHKAPITQYQQQRRFLRFSRDLGSIPLESLTPLVLRTWSERLLRTLAPGTVRQHLDSLSAVLTVAVEDLGWLTAHPLKKVRKPPASPKRVRFLSDDERTRLLKACLGSQNPYLYVVVLLAMATGCRKGELFGLRWKDIDLERGYLRLAQTKNGERRAVAIPRVALEVLKAWHTGQPPEEWVFTGRRSPGNFPGEQAWETALKRAGITDFHFHDLRHTCASYLALSGTRVEDIAEILGHKNVTMTMRYRHVTLPHTRGAVERMADRFLKDTTATTTRGEDLGEHD